MYNCLSPLIKDLEITDDGAVGNRLEFGCIRRSGESIKQSCKGDWKRG